MLEKFRVLTMTDAQVEELIRAAVFDGAGEKVVAPGHPYDGFIRLDVGIYFDPEEKAPHFNLPELLAAVELDDTPENRQILVKNLRKHADTAGAEMILLDSEEEAEERTRQRRERAREREL